MPQKPNLLKLELPNRTEQFPHFIARSERGKLYTISTDGSITGGMWALGGDSVYGVGIDRNKVPTEIYLDYEQSWEGRVRHTMGPIEETRENMKWLKQINKMYPGYFVLQYVHLTAIPNQSQWREVQPIYYRANDPEAFYEGITSKPISKEEIAKGLERKTILEVSRRKFDLGDTLDHYDKVFLLPNKKIMLGIVSEASIKPQPITS